MTRKRLVRSGFRTVTFVFVDVMALLLSFGLAYYFRCTVLPHILAVSPYVTPLSYFKNFWPLIFTWPIIFTFKGLYSRRLPNELEAIELAKANFFALLIAVAIIFYARGSIFSRSIILLTFLFSLFIFPFFRLLAKNSL